MSIMTMIDSFRYSPARELKLADGTKVKLITQNVKGVPYVRLKEFNILKDAYAVLMDNQKDYAKKNADLTDEIQSLKEKLFLKKESGKDNDVDIVPKMNF